MAVLKKRKKQRFPSIPTSPAAIGGAAAAAGGVLVLLTKRGRSLLFGKGKAATNAVTPTAATDYNDVTLARKVESEIFRPADAPKGKVSVNAENGVVFLRGELEDTDQIETLEKAARKVDGVKEVENLLHPPAATR